MSPTHPRCFYLPHTGMIPTAWYLPRCFYLQHDTYRTLARQTSDVIQISAINTRCFAKNTWMYVPDRHFTSQNNSDALQKRKMRTEDCKTMMITSHTTRGPFPSRSTWLVRSATIPWFAKLQIILSSKSNLRAVPPQNFSKGNLFQIWLAVCIVTGYDRGIIV